MGIEQTAIYGPVKIPLLSDWSLSAIAGNLPAATYDIQTFQLNRAGRTFNTTQQIVLGATGGIRITLNTSQRTMATDLFAVGFAINDIQIARFEARAIADEAELPMGTLDITEVEHVNENIIIADQASLPTGIDLINGMLRHSTADATTYRYRSDATSGEVPGNPSGYWVLHQTEPGDSDYQDSGDITLARIDDPGGYARRISLVENEVSAPTKVTGIDSVPIKFAFANNEIDDGGAIISQGRLLDLVFGVDGQFSVEDSGVVRSYSDIFAGLVKVQVLGYGDFSDFSLDVNPAVAETLWFPGTTALQLKANLPRGQYFLIQFIYSFNNSQLGGAIAVGSTIDARMQDKGILGIPAPTAAAIGNSVFPGGNLYRIVPNLRLDGEVAFIGGPDGGDQFFYQVPQLGESSIPFVAADTANQYVVMDGAQGGSVRAIQNIGNQSASEAIRAIVSTEAGTGSYITESSTLTIALNSSLVIDITHPVNSGRATIRASYPDVVATNSMANLLAEQMIVAIQDTSSSNVFVRNVTNAVTFASNQQITINGLGDFTNVGTSFPTNPDPAFGLFEPDAIAISEEIATGTFPAGSYRVRIAYTYVVATNSIFTKITHDPLNGVEMVESTQTLAELLAAPTSLWQTVFTSVAQMEAANPAILNLQATYKLQEPGQDSIAHYDLRQNEPGTADGNSIIEITSDTTYKFYRVGGDSSSNIWEEFQTLMNLRDADVNTLATPYQLVSEEPGRPPLLYRYNLASSAAESVPAVIQPTIGTGRYDQAGTPTFYESGVPAIPPPVYPAFYIDTDAGGFTYIAVGTATAADWRRTGATRLSDLTNVTEIVAQPSTSATLRVLADNDTDGIYDPFDWTPPGAINGLDDLNDVDIIAAVPNFNPTVRVLADINADGTYVPIDWTPSTAGGGGGGKEVLTGNRTYYVRPNGNDSNSGLLNDDSNAFATWQRAIDVIVSTLNLSGFTVTVLAGTAGTWTIDGQVLITLRNHEGAGTVILQGDPVTPSNVILETTTSGRTIGGDTILTNYIIDGFEFRPAGSALVLEFSKGVKLQNCNFEATSAFSQIILDGSDLEFTGDWEVNGSADRHITANWNSRVIMRNQQLRFNGVINFNVTFILSNNGSNIIAGNMTFVGSFIGQRFEVLGNATIETGGDPNYFPGTIAGVADPVTYGVYF